MAEIEEELNITLEAQRVQFTQSPHNDQIVFQNVGLSDMEAATLAWLCKQSPETLLKFKLKVAS